MWPERSRLLRQNLHSYPSARVNVQSPVSKTHAVGLRYIPRMPVFETCDRNLSWGNVQSDKQFNSLSPQPYVGYL
jgi:hypothetical protein